MTYLRVAITGRLVVAAVAFLYVAAAVAVATFE